MTWKKGQTGNPNGRPRVGAIAELNQAIAVVEKKKRRKLLEHFAARAFEDDYVLTALMKKKLPDLKAIDSSDLIQGLMGLSYLTDEQLRKETEALEAKRSSLRRRRRRPKQTNTRANKGRSGTAIRPKTRKIN